MRDGSSNVPLRFTLIAVCLVASVLLRNHAWTAADDADDRDSAIARPLGTDPASTPAIRALRAFHRSVHTRLAGEISRSDSAIAGLMDRWLDVPNYARLQQMLAGIHATRMIGWTDSGFDMEEFQSLWIVELLDGEVLVLWANREAIAVTCLSREDRQAVDRYGRALSGFFDATAIYGDDKWLGGGVTLLVVADQADERYYYSHNYEDEKKWEPLLRQREDVLHLLGQLVKSRIVEQSACRH